MSHRLPHSPSSQGEFLKTGDAAAKLHVSAQTLRDWADDGKITAITSDSGHRQYYEAEVNRAALAEEGITQYWNAQLGVGLKADGSIIYLTEDYTVAHAPEEAHQTWSEDFTRFWEYTNGRQLAPHTAALNSEPTVNPESYDTPEVIEIEAGENIILIDLIVLGRNKDETIQKLGQEAIQAISYLRKNFTPKVNYDWYNSNGEKLIKE